MSNPTEQIMADVAKYEDTLSVQNKASQYEKEEYDGEEKIKYIPTPNFTDCSSAETQLPINLANEAITLLSKYRSEFDFVDFIKDKLKYDSRLAVCMAFVSEQVDALVLAIKQFENGKALILGDMAGIGKGRVCAGIQRYAYVNNLIPVFITEKENLFSNMFMDTMDIGGFLGSQANVIQRPKPFILNPKSRSIITDDLGNRVRVTTNNLTNNDGDVIYEPLDSKDIDYILKRYRKSFPFEAKKYDFNCVYLTYSAISLTKGESGDNKREFINNISSNAILIFDECHNASGRSTIGDYCKKYVAQSRGCMFSSATFAKNPQSFPLYIIKTAMAEADIDIEKIEKAIGVGGENVSEYISSVLVKEGQMIRRERSFANCSIGTIYEGGDKNQTEASEIRSRIYSTFDNATAKFRDIYNYVTSKRFNRAIKQAIVAKALDDDIDLADQQEYLDVRSGGSSPKKTSERDNFIRENRGKWVIYSYQENTLGANTKFHFSENLLLAVKAKFTADAIIKELQSEVEYTNFDGKKRKTNRKPVIALRATGETLFDKLNLKSGDLIANDFSEYVRAIVMEVRLGRVTFRKVDNELFYNGKERAEKAKERAEKGSTIINERVEKYTVTDDLLPDAGEELNSLLLACAEYNSGVPLSSIDYLIDKIQSEVRKPFDKFGSVSLNYTVGEVTGRNYMLKRVPNTDSWSFSKNERDKSVKTAFNKFNSGRIDVLIINSSGSTGGSIQSSETFADKRPRIMFIMQIELNVATEVQKRGRINRTGQVNYPAYLYVLSLVPSEIRKFLSLKRKLRRLDANTSANQTQNSNIVEVRDRNGEVIEDIFNIYGEEAFGQFLSNDENFRYKDVYDIMNEDWTTEAFTEEFAQEGDIVANLLAPFTRLLDIYPCTFQEGFYDSINTLYKSIVESHKATGTYQLELDIEDLKASLKSRSVKTIYNGLTEFSKPLFIEDKMCLDRRRKWSKEKLDAEIVRMAEKFYIGRDDEFQNVRLFHTHLLEDFDLVFNGYIESKMAEFIESKRPNEKEFDDKEKYELAVRGYEDLVVERRIKLDNEKAITGNLLSYYVPDKPVIFPEYVGSGEEVTTVYHRGKFVGYSFKGTSQENRYSKGAVYFKFAFLDGDLASREININMSLALLSDIIRISDSTFRREEDAKARGSKNFTEKEQINAWLSDSNKRRVVRFLSGNILSGIQEANDMKKRKEISRWHMVKYTNSDGTESVGLQLSFPERMPEMFRTIGGEKVLTDKIKVKLDNPNVLEYLRMTPPDYEFNLSVFTQGSKSVPKYKDPDKNARVNEYNVEGLIRVAKPSNRTNVILVTFFQGKYDKSDSSTRAELNASNSNNPIYFAPFIKDFDDVYYDSGQYTARNKGDTNGYLIFSNDFKGADKYRRKSGYNMRYRFDNIDTEEGGNRLQQFLNAIAYEQPITINFPQNISDYYTVADRPDDFVTEEEKRKQLQSLRKVDGGEDVYEYKLDVEFNAKYEQNPPPKFIRYEKGKTSLDKGSVFLSEPLIPTYAKAYNIYPINFSNQDTIALLLSIFNQDERTEFENSIVRLVEDGKSIGVIGDFVANYTRKRSVPELKYIFGNRRLNDIGELLKTYAMKGELKSLPVEFEPLGEEIDVPKRKRTLQDNDAYSVAEKFVNYLLF